MNRKQTLAAAVILVFSAALLSAGEDTRKNAVSLNPLGMLLNMYSGSYERALTELVSVKVTAAYSPNFIWISDIAYTDIQVEGRYYFGWHLRNLAEDLPFGKEKAARLFAPALNGFYVGFMAGMVTASIDDWEGTVTEVPVKFDARFFGLGGGVSLGAKYALTGKRFTFFAEPWLGLQFYAPVGGANGWTYTDSNTGGDLPKPDEFEDGFGRSPFTFGINAGLAF